MLSILARDIPNKQKIQLYLEISKCGLPIESLKYAQKARELSLRLKDRVREAEALEEISLSNRKLGNNVQAIKASREALSIYKELGLHKREAALFVQLGTHFTNDKDFFNGLKYIRKGLLFYETQRDTFNIILANINMGETYRLMGNPDSAAICFQKSLTLNSNNQLIRAYSLGNLGMVHSSSGKYKLALKELREAVEILSSLGDLPALTVFQLEIGKLLILDGEENKGLALLTESLVIAEQEHLKEQIRDLSKYLATYYEKIGDYKLAVKLRKQYENYHDSLVNLENMRKIEHMENQIALEKKEASILLLEESNHNKKILLLFFSIASCILLTVTVLLFRTGVKKQEANFQLQEQKRKLEKRDKEKALLLRELNHRVKNNLQMVSSLFNMQLHQFKDHPVADALRAGKFRVEALTLIHQKLYGKNLTPKIELKEYIEELVKNLVNNFEDTIQLKLKLETFSLGIDQAIPLGLIINELTTNSLKYAYRDASFPTLSIELLTHPHHLCLKIRDNGPGIPEVWQPNQANSLGLKLVKSLTNQLKGQIHQNNNSGCEWTLLLPVDKLQKAER
ncbi:MAG: histidine kinase dimerization/phosphoacceptor domain -containing protein [Marinifilaceae bacterium]